MPHSEGRGWRAHIDRRSQGRLRHGRDSARRAAARIHIHISKLAPHGPLCR